MKNTPETLTSPTEEADGGPAFPVEVNVIDSNGSHIEQSYGLTKRDYFAAAVAGAVWARMVQQNDDGLLSDEALMGCVQRIPYEIADTLLKQRCKE